jgi:hypothetical protein
MRATRSFALVVFWFAMSGLSAVIGITTRVSAP